MEEAFGKEKIDVIIQTTVGGSRDRKAMGESCPETGLSHSIHARSAGQSLIGKWKNHLSSLLDLRMIFVIDNL